MFRDDRDRALYVGKSQRIRSRVRTYFTASETRTRMAEMVGLAERVDAVPCDEQQDAKIQALTLEQVNTAFRKYVEPAGVSIVKAGDFKKVGVYQ